MVREHNASGYPLYLPPTTWANCRNPTDGLLPTSHTFCTAYPTTIGDFHVLKLSITCCRTQAAVKFENGGPEIILKSSKILFKLFTSIVFWHFLG